MYVYEITTIIVLHSLMVLFASNKKSALDIFKTLLLTQIECHAQSVKEQAQHSKDDA